MWQAAPIKELEDEIEKDTNAQYDGSGIESDL